MAAGGMILVVLAVSFWSIKSGLAVPPLRFQVHMDNYLTFIEQLRSEIALIQSSSLFRNGTDDQRFVTPTNPPVDDRYIQIELVSAYDQGSVIIALDVTNLYLVAYRAGHFSYHFQTENPVFTDRDLIPRTIRLTPNYKPLEKAAGVSRLGRFLSLEQLNNAIAGLYTNSIQQNEGVGHQMRCTYLIDLIQMISEAARFDIIAQTVNRNADERTTAEIIALETSWAPISRAVLRATGDLLGSSSNGQDQQLRVAGENVYSLRHLLISSIALLLGTACTQKSSRHRRYAALSEPISGACQASEPTAYIVGWNGMCVDVRGGQFYYGNPIILGECNPHAASQRWTFKLDGTVRSNGKCLTRADMSGNPPTLYDCELVKSSNAIKWTVTADGSIANFASGTYLTSESGKKGDALSTKLPNFALGQGWQLTDRAQPITVDIFQEHRGCVVAVGERLVFQNCSAGRAKQWAFHPDGSVRPVSNTANCFTFTEKEGARAFPVFLAPCKPSFPHQRWALLRSGLIMSTGNKYGLTTVYHREQYHVFAADSETLPLDRWSVRF